MKILKPDNYDYIDDKGRKIKKISQKEYDLFLRQDHKSEINAILDNFDQKTINYILGRIVARIYSVNNILFQQYLSLDKNKRTIGLKYIKEFDKYAIMLMDNSHNAVQLLAEYNEEDLIAVMVALYSELEKLNPIKRMEVLKKFDLMDYIGDEDDIRQ